MKKAFLVEYCIRTRVVVDVEDEGLSGKDLDKISSKATYKILSDADNYVISDNIIDIEEDYEVPYDPEFDE